MYLKYGTYQHALQEAAPAIKKQGLVNEAGELYAIKHTWSITGKLMSTDHSTLLTDIASLEAAYTTSGYDLYLLDDDASTVVASLTSSNTTGGTKIITPPSFPIADGGELTTYRTYEIVIEGEVPINASRNPFVSWQETIEFTGTGGPRFVIIECINGPPVAQQVAQRTPVRVTQSGSAVGYEQYPSPPGPIWPQWEKQEERRIRPTSPRTTGTGANRSVQNFGIAWSYSFESPSALSGFPHAQQ